ncbi:hypothetical protein ACELLULO517_18985 [Acidisoma cellulosilytica]|uniref:Uncharacterized protein n=1 Tax=Acidisoma cellulosilyticum TaxID=2802395 RepID=A0A963Z4J9_9PROT|nr:hypothetical protein [Acidisoma cellulosilyticum]MCB8882341.1 hypothetical protein [Acidisoma cellulosilyticum]
MPQMTDRQLAIIAERVELARDTASDLSQVLLTHYQDADTLDLFQPGNTDLELTQAINRAVAAEFLESGVEVVVQRADKAAFRRWMTDREDKPETRHGWINRTRLLRGKAAMELLGLKDIDGPPPAFGKIPGPVADRLLAAYEDDESPEFDTLVQALLRAERIDILDLAIRKIREMQGDDAADDLKWVFLVAAEGAEIGPSGWMELVALPVALAAGRPPDGAELGHDLVASGALGPEVEVHLLPGWRSADALDALSYGAIRSVLMAVADGCEPSDLPPGDTDDLAKNGFGLLIGCRLDWAIPIWEAIVADGGLPEPPEEDAAETPEEARRTALFDGWRERIFEDSKGCVPLELVPFSEVKGEIAAFWADAGDQTRGLNDIREFVTICRNEAGGEDVVCRPEVIGNDLELTLYTVDGRFLDSLTMPASRLPAKAQEMPRLIASFVDLVRDAPGR